MSSPTEKIVPQVTSEETKHSLQSKEFETGQLEDVLTDGGYGWICVVAVFLINAHTWGINICYSVFLAHYLGNNTLKDATSLDYAFIGGFLFAQPLFIAPLAIKVAGKFGVRICLLIGVVLETGSLIGASYATNIWHLYVAQGLGFSWGIGFFFVATQNVICQWFTKRRGLASGLAASGTGVGALTYALASGHMIAEMSTGKALRILAVVAGCVTFVCSLLIKDRNAYIEPQYELFDFKVLKKPRYWVLFLFAAFNLLGETIILTYIPTYGAETLNLNGSQISIIGAMMALGQILGRSTIGAAGDAFGRLNVTAIVTFLCGLWTVLVWPLAHSYAVLIFYSICAGAFAGSLWAVVAVVCAEVMGLQDLPTSLSMLYVLVTIPVTFSPVIGQEIISTTGSFLGAQLFSGFMFLTSAVFMWILRCYKLQAQKRVPSEAGSQALSGLNAIADNEDWSLLALGCRQSLFEWAKI